MKLPFFPYHPDPIASGSVIASNESCACCGEWRGYIYTSSVYSEHDPSPMLCPWCIANGSAHKKFDASFNDTSNIVDHVPPDVADQVAHRTPGFFSWQQEVWLSCCGDAAAFIDSVGHAEMRARYPELEAALSRFFVHDFHLPPDRVLGEIKKLNLRYGPTAHAFRCRHCLAWKTYVDFT